MKYADIKYYDIANGLGVRTSLFVSGCTHRCRGCFNENTWDFNYGNDFTEETIQEILESISPKYISGLTLLGGEPMEPSNQRALETDLLSPDGRAHCEATEAFLSYVDVLVDGEFDQNQYDISLKFRGSKNQRILQIQKEGCPQLFPL